MENTINKENPAEEATKAIATATANAVVFKNPELNRATAELIATIQSEAKSIMARAKILAEINERKLFAEDGFKNIVDYGEKIFKWKRAYIYQLIAAWNKYGESPLMLPDGTEAQFSAGQLQEMASITHEQAQEMVAEGKITPDMTTRAIREAVAEAHPVEEKPKREKVYMWSVVTPKKSPVEIKGTQTEICAKAIKDGWDFAERLSTTDSVYIVGIHNGIPVMYRRNDEVKPEKTSKK